ncbi:MAG: hypothetical protein PHU23_01290 [Dehalococcoidales bacterium]|nr:hypothetical protein [Dehalococcoidales bacterium]
MTDMQEVILYEKEIDKSEAETENSNDQLAKDTTCKIYSHILDQSAPYECIDYLSKEGKDLWIIIRKLASNKKAIGLIVLLANAPNGMSFGDLKKKTGMDTNDINHTLLGLREIGLIIQDEDSKKYSITEYCAAILYTFRRINNSFEWLNASHKLGRQIKYTQKNANCDPTATEG